MKRIVITAIFLTVLLSYKTQAQNNFLMVKSLNSVEETVAKLSSRLSNKSMRIFSSIDHQAGATKVGLELRSTYLVIFGNPKVGSVLMQCDQRAGVELPLKILVWEDEREIVWIGYRNPLLLMDQYDLEDCQDVLEKIKNAMANFASTAASEK